MPLNEMEMIRELRQRVDALEEIFFGRVKEGQDYVNQEESTDALEDSNV